jgi:para-nitrobenzyl esterase
MGVELGNGPASGQDNHFAETDFMIAKRRYLTGKLRLALALGVFGAMSLARTARSVAEEALRVEGGMIAPARPDAAGIRGFKGIPFAAPPVGELRWRAPRPVTPWPGERTADQFGPKCMQTARLGDIDPLNPRMSEDCLYLNVWTPVKSANDRLPVMVWIYGGSFNVGAGSEPWYDGANLAKKGVIVVTLNYRVDVFGFLSHPGLTAESDHHASGNYGLMDQAAALGWVKRNIAAFGGDPGRVTIFGESAGSLSVSALMGSPIGRGLFQRAIGESGAMLYPGKSPYALPSLAKAEQAGVKFADMLSAHSVAELRAKSAEAVLEAVTKNPTATAVSRGPIIDGYVLPVNAAEIFAKGQQTDVPLLAGSNADEGTLFAGRVRPPPTPESYTEQVRKLFGDHAAAVLKVYPDGTPEQTKASFAALLGDQLISYPTWLWDELQARTGKAPTYRYFFDLRPPAPETSLTPLAAAGVFHTAEILYVFDNLQVRDWPWRPEDRRMAEIVSSYWVNFAKNGNPNGPGLPDWPTYAGPNGTVMRLAARPGAGPDPHLARYEALNEFYFGEAR